MAGEDRQPRTGDPEIDEVLQRLAELEGTVDDEEEREEVQRVRRAVERMPGGSALGARIDKYTTRDVAEGFVGSIVFALPLLVEDGVNDIAAHLLTARAAGVPVWLAVHLAFVIVVTWGLLYWADFRELEESDPLFGLLPKRLVGVLLVAWLTAAATMTMWGRIDWADPTVALARTAVVWAVAAIGAALGDILPGESRGEDIGDVVDDTVDDLVEALAD